MKTKSVTYMPLFLSLSLFINAGVWFTFAILVNDFYVLVMYIYIDIIDRVLIITLDMILEYIFQVPNAVGIVLGSLQLMVYAIYKNKTRIPKSIAAEDVKEMKTKEMNGQKDVEEGGHEEV